MNNIHINNRKGFTLIELLVVISIIALLVSIIMPSLGTARQLAQQAACLATLKGIGQSWLMYLDANDRKWPLKDSDGNSIIEIPESYSNGVFYDEGGAKAYTLNEALKDEFSINGWKCSSSQGKEEFDKRGSSYGFLPAPYLEIFAVTGQLEGLIKAYESEAASAPLVTDVMGSDDTSCGPHRMNPTDDSLAGYNGVYYDGHVEVSDKDTLNNNVKTITKAFEAATE